MAETGHHASRVFIDQDGNFNLNGAQFKNDADADISGALENANNMLLASATGFAFRGGTSANSTTGINTPAHGLTTVLGGFANPCSTAASISSTTDAIAQCTVQISGSTFQFVSYKHTSTTDPTLIIATSSAHRVSWGVFGVV